MSAAFAVSTSQSRAGTTVSHRRRISPAISPQVAVKLDYHGLQADPSRPAGRLPDPLLEAVYGLRGNPPLGVLARREAEPRKLCLLYTSDAADDLLCVDLGGRRIIKKKK